MELCCWILILACSLQEFQLIDWLFQKLLQLLNFGLLCDNSSIKFLLFYLTKIMEGIEDLLELFMLPLPKVFYSFLREDWIHSLIELIFNSIYSISCKLFTLRRHKKINKLNLIRVETIIVSPQKELFPISRKPIDGLLVNLLYSTGCLFQFVVHLFSFV